ncbi:hypothetical protein [Bartonella sp. HY761]|uniref:hypothetical protein n=1 Tax=Bartonella sp. HY761 TaxID=2979330 RepID=UPI002207C955|nr:hypothetical protein [Bartonella sp. HY761]UXN05419.1 hypothetical protein N6A79_08860 [Bartonella sp. HY761]
MEKAVKSKRTEWGIARLLLHKNKAQIFALLDQKYTALMIINMLELPVHRTTFYRFVSQYRHKDIKNTVLPKTTDTLADSTPDKTATKARPKVWKRPEMPSFNYNRSDYKLEDLI